MNGGRMDHSRNNPANETHVVRDCQQPDTLERDEPGMRHVRNSGVGHLFSGRTASPSGRIPSSVVTEVTVMFGPLMDDARAEALFVTNLQRSECPTAEQVREAVLGAFYRHGGSRNCAALVAHEFGEHPETAVARMRWARETVHAAFCDGEHLVPGQFSPAAARSAGPVSVR
jgi:hypothetical protein